MNCYFPSWLQCLWHGTESRGLGRGQQWGAEGPLAEAGLQPLLCPPRAGRLGDREGQLQLACPFSLFLLDFLALDSKLRLLLKLLLKNKFHMHYPSSALDRIKKETFPAEAASSALTCRVPDWKRGVCAGPFSFSLSETPFQLSEMPLGANEDRTPVPSHLFSGICGSQSTENPLWVGCERKAWTSKHETEERKSNKLQWGFISSNTITQGSEGLFVISLAAFSRALCRSSSLNISLLCASQHPACCWTEVPFWSLHQILAFAFWFPLGSIFSW